MAVLTVEAEYATPAERFPILTGHRPRKGPTGASLPVEAGAEAAGGRNGLGRLARRAGGDGVVGAALEVRQGQGGAPSAVSSEFFLAPEIFPGAGARRTTSGKLSLKSLLRLNPELVNF